MTQIINLTERLDKDRCRLEDPVAYTLIHALTAYELKHGRNSLPELTLPFNGGKMDSTKIEVEFKMNGVEMDFIEFMNRIFEGREEYIHEAALELIKERFDGVLDRIDTLKIDVINKIREGMHLEKRED